MAGSSYSSPPIIEAHIEFRFDNEISIEDIGKIYKKLSKHYPNTTQLTHKHYEVRLDTETLGSQEIPITRGSTTDEGDLILIAPAFLSVTRMSPYAGWTDFIERIKRLYAEAKAVSGYRKISRIGVRFVNRLDLSMIAGRVEYEDYFNLRINLPADFPDLSGYMINFRSHSKETECSITVHSGVVEPAVIGCASFVLDIDIAREQNLPQKDDNILLLLEQMRHEKNKLFETFITDKAREMFHAR